MPFFAPPPGWLLVFRNAALDRIRGNDHQLTSQRSRAMTDDRNREFSGMGDPLSPTARKDNPGGGKGGGGQGGGGQGGGGQGGGGQGGGGGKGPGGGGGGNPG